MSLQFSGEAKAFLDLPEPSPGSISTVVVFLSLDILTGVSWQTDRKNKGC